MAIIFKRLCVKELTGVRGGALAAPMPVDIRTVPTPLDEYPVIKRSAECLIGELGTAVTNDAANCMR